MEHHEPRTVVLLLLAIWGFCRAYYFAFYVVEHYIDPGYRYAGLTSFVLHSRRRWLQPTEAQGRQPAEPSAPAHRDEKSVDSMVE